MVERGECHVVVSPLPIVSNDRGGIRISKLNRKLLDNFSNESDVTSLQDPILTRP